MKKLQFFLILSSFWLALPSFAAESTAVNCSQLSIREFEAQIEAWPDVELEALGEECVLQANRLDDLALAEPKHTKADALSAAAQRAMRFATDLKATLLERSFSRLD